MQTKKRLLIHSDNATWAGSENMIGVFLKSPEINEKYDVVFSFRRSDDYIDGMHHWLGDLHVPAKMIGHDPFSSKLYGWPKIVRGVLRPFFVGSESYAFEDTISRVKPDLVHINNGGYPGAMTCNSMAMAAGRLGVPVTYMLNSTARNLPLDSYYTDTVRQSVTKFVSASRNLMESAFFLHRSRKLPHLMPSNWTIIPNTIVQEPKPYLELEDDVVRIAACGVPEERKGFHLLIEAAKSFPQYRFYIVLTDTSRYSRKLVEMVLDNHLENNVLVIGVESKQIINLISQMNLLVIPSIKDEDFPNVMLMAIKCGVEVVAADLGGIGECVPYENLFTPGDVEEMIDAIHRGVEYPNAKEDTIGYYNSKYSREVIINKWLALWDSILR